MPSARSVFGRWSRPPATGRGGGGGGAGARYDTDFNSVGGYYSGPHNANYSIDAGDLNANVMARTTAQDKALGWTRFTSARRIIERTQSNHRRCREKQRSGDEFSLASGVAGDK